MHYEVAKYMNRKRRALIRVGDDGVRETLAYFRDERSAEAFTSDLASSLVRPQVRFWPSFTTHT